MERSGAGMETVVAIDGPAGAGKSTVARLVAERLGYLYVDTGAMYRGVAYLALQKGLDPGDGEALARAAEAADLSYRTEGSGRGRLFVEGRDVTDLLRAPEISRLVPVVAEHPQVREVLVRLQRRLAEGGGVVMDGRDIGSYVLPDAGCKFFLTASSPVRVKRRWNEYVASGRDAGLTQEEVAAELERRDRLDRRRGMGPLKRAADAELIDTSDLSVDEVVRRIVDRCRNGRRP